MPSRNSDILLRNFVRRIQWGALALSGAVGFVLFLLWSRQVAFGYLSGAAVSVMNFRLMVADSSGVGKREGRKAKRFIVGRYFLRYGIMAGYIAGIAFKTDFNIFAAFAGLMAIQVTLLGNAFILSGVFSGKELM